MSACLLGTVTRSLLTLPSLSIGGPTDPIQFNGANDAAGAADWSGDQWDRQLAESPWVHGEHLVFARRTNSDISMSLWIMADTPELIRTHYLELRDAVSQWSWQLTLAFDTASYSYFCQPSDISLGFTRTHGLRNAAPVQLQVPVSPSY